MWLSSHLRLIPVTALTMSIVSPYERYSTTVGMILPWYLRGSTRIAARMSKAECSLAPQGIRKARHVKEEGATSTCSGQAYVSNGMPGYGGAASVVAQSIGAIRLPLKLSIIDQILIKCAGHEDRVRQARLPQVILHANPDMSSS